MEGDGFILSKSDFTRYNGHEQIDKYYFTEGSKKASKESVPANPCPESLKEWMRPTIFNSEDLERWKATPSLRILMIKTKNEFSRNPDQYKPSHRTIPGRTEVKPRGDREEQIRMVKEIFRHARLPLAAIGAYLKSHITFLGAPSYEVVDDEGTSTGEVTAYYCSGTSWSLAWSYFHKTRHTSGVLFYREGDGDLRRAELEEEIERLREHISHPLLLAYVKTQISLVWTFHQLEQMNGKTFEIEKSVGLATWDWVLDRRIEADQDSQADDPDIEESIARRQKEAVERYNVLNGRLINIRFRLRSSREQIRWLRRMNDTYLESIIKEDTSYDGRSRECLQLNTMLERMDDFNKVYLHDADTLADRLSQQMSSMSHIVSQRDSRISLAIADINNELAWHSKNTNSAMMAIAVATFLFLPATFIASVFDTSIFNWPLPGESTINTEPFWIFWGTCALTTALLCLCWWLYIKKKSASIKQRREDEKKAFRRKILRVPTFQKRARRNSTKAEVAPVYSGWQTPWNGRFGGKDVDIEMGLGIGAERAASFGKN